jgi:hypothetical protein
MAANALYASLFSPVAHIDLLDPPASHRDGPIYLNVLRHLDLSQAAALAIERSTLLIFAKDPAPWRFAADIDSNLPWDKQRARVTKLTVHPKPESP